jgi:hypothetical protein
MDIRKYFLQPLFVALLIILPVPVAAAPLPALEQAEQTAVTPTAPAAEFTAEPLFEATAAATVATVAETTVESTAEVTPEITVEATAAPLSEAVPEPTLEPTPEPTLEPTPVPAPVPVEEVEDEAPNAVTDLHATAGRLRGRVELGWRFVIPARDGDEQSALGDDSVFVVERSTNGGSWRPVKVCYQPLDPEADTYSCTDSRLTSGATYAYRVCLASRPTTCSNALPTDPVAVKAP